MAADTNTGARDWRCRNGRGVRYSYGSLPARDSHRFSV